VLGKEALYGSFASFRVDQVNACLCANANDELYPVFLLSMQDRLVSLEVRFGLGIQHQLGISRALFDPFEKPLMKAGEFRDQALPHLWIRGRSGSGTLRS
jgi:hypothetical protein